MASDPTSDAYEVVFPSGKDERVPLFFAIDDEGAIQIALMLRDEREMHIWCGSRLVASYPSQNHVMVSEPSATALPPALSPVSLDIH